MNVFELRERLISDYSSYIRSFIRIRDERVDALVTSCLDQGRLWPDPLIQLNPSFQYAGTIDDLVAEGVLHSECSRIFRAGKDKGEGKPLRLYQHQADAIRRARAGRNYVLTTGTGSGKSLAYIVPIVDHVLRHGSGRGIQAIVVYPMNALANSQFGELQKFLQLGYPDGKGPVTFARYTGQERDEERNAIVAKPPDILLTNYVMLELILTRVYEKQLVKAAQGLRFLVLDEALILTEAGRGQTSPCSFGALGSSSGRNSSRSLVRPQHLRGLEHTTSSKQRWLRLPAFCSELR